MIANNDEASRSQAGAERNLERAAAEADAAADVQLIVINSGIGAIEPDRIDCACSNVEIAAVENARAVESSWTDYPSSAGGNRSDGACTTECSAEYGYRAVGLATGDE